MDGYKAFKYYLAVKLHFTRDNFDVFKNRGNIKGSRDAFNARNDRYIFERLARKFPVDKDLIQFYVSNFAYGNDAVVYSYEEAETNFLEWNKRKQSITKVFSDDCDRILLSLYKEKIKPEFVFNFNGSTYPLLLKLFLGKIITIETVKIFDIKQQLVYDWKMNSSVMLLWENEIRRIEKLTGFIKFEDTKIDKVLNTFKQELEEI